MAIEIALFEHGSELNYPEYKRVQLSHTGWHIVGQSIGRIEPVNFAERRLQIADLIEPRRVANGFGVYSTETPGDPFLPTILVAVGECTPPITVMGQVTPQLYPLRISLSPLSPTEATALLRQLTNFKGPLRPSEDVLLGALSSLERMASRALAGMRQKGNHECSL